MLTQKKIIIFGAGILGRRALNFFGPDSVYCFADNYKAGQTFWGKPVISFDELRAAHRDYDVVISVGAGSCLDLETQCKQAGIPYSHFHHLVSCEDYDSNPEIARFKDIHKGGRCFLIGNGPSLAADDLTTLHERGEICFACNLISKIYDKTPWRPNYYVIADPVLLLVGDMLADVKAGYKFFPEIADIYREDKENDIKSLFERKGGRITYYRPISCISVTEKPHFSRDVSKAVYISSTIIYVMMQFAAYMGFTEIYLLGVDGTTISLKDTEQYLSEKRHFYDDDENIVRQMSSYFIFDKAESSIIRVAGSYETAEEYTREHGIRIYNATRGGIIETFERVDFDSLF